MNIITDTLDEIRKMKFRKVCVAIPSLVLISDCFDIVASLRTQFWHDCLLRIDDLEHTQSCC